MEKVKILIYQLIGLLPDNWPEEHFYAAWVCQSTEVRYPVAALWELYKFMPRPKTMGKSCFGVQARCPVAWSPVTLLKKPNIYNYWLSAPRAAVKRGIESGEEEQEQEYNFWFKIFIWNALAASESLNMINCIFICVLCGLYGVFAKGEQQVFFYV